MRALRLHRIRTDGQPAQMSVDEVVRPSPGSAEVVVEVHACGVCKEDFDFVNGLAPVPGSLPRTLGHEAAGVVAEVGPEITDWQPGDRVAVLFAKSCHTCVACSVGRHNLCRKLRVRGRDDEGGFAAFLLADSADLIPLPPDMPFEQAAITTDALATPYHALKRVGIGEGVTLAVLGSGRYGLHAIQLAKLAGATILAIDSDPVALERARSWGADETFTVSDSTPEGLLREATRDGLDRSLDFIGTPTSANHALTCLGPGGRAALVGMAPEPMASISRTELVSREIEVVGSFGSTPQDVGELFDLYEGGRLDLGNSVTARIGLDQVEQSLEELGSASGDHICTVVTSF